MKKKSILISSALTILLSAGMLAGATYSLFTSESTHNIIVSSGTVDVRSSVDQSSIKLSSMGKETGSMNFDNGGSFAIENSLIKLDKLTPGDKVVFDIDIKNYSNVTAQYRCVLKAKSGYTLFSKLLVNLDEIPWSIIEPSQTPDNPETTKNTVSIELPVDTGNEYQGLSTEFYILVEATQGNAIIENDNVQKIANQTLKGTATPEEIEKNKSYTLNSIDTGFSLKIPKTFLDTTKPTEITAEIANVDVSDYFKEKYLSTERGTGYIAYEIKANGLKNQLTRAPKPFYTINLFIGKGLSNVHSVLDLTNDYTGVKSAEYNQSTGIITIKSYTLSKFVITFDQIAYLSNNRNAEKNNETLQYAVDNYKNIELLSDFTLKLDPNKLVNNSIISLSAPSDIYLKGHNINIELGSDTISSSPAMFDVNIAKGNGDFTFHGTGTETIDCTAGNNKVYIANVNTKNKGDGFAAYNLKMVGSPVCLNATFGEIFLDNISDCSISKEYKSPLEKENNLLDFDETALINDNIHCQINSSELRFNIANFNENGKTFCLLDNDPGFIVFDRVRQNEHFYEIVDISDFNNIVKANPTYALDADLTIVPEHSYNENDEIVIVSIDKDIVFDLNNHNISFVNVKGTMSSTSGGYPTLFDIAYGSTLTIQGNGTIDTTYDCYQKIPFTSIVKLNGSTSKCVINNGHFIGSPTVARVLKGNLEINGGTFEVSSKLINGGISNAPSTIDPKQSLIYVNKDNYEAKTATINIKGGKFMGYNPANNNALGAGTTGTNIVAEGYVATPDKEVEPTYWTVGLA